MMERFLGELEERALLADSELALDLVERALTRWGSFTSLIANFKEPRVVRRCLGEDNKRLLKQVITGRMF